MIRQKKDFSDHAEFLLEVSSQLSTLYTWPRIATGSRAISVGRYVDQPPVKAVMRPQTWSFYAWNGLA